jgi:hypothetical protein
LVKNENYARINLEIKINKEHRVHKYIIIASLSLCSTLLSMDQTSNTPKTIPFDPYYDLYPRLVQYGYGPLADKTGFHVILGNKNYPCDGAKTLIRYSISQYYNTQSNKIIDEHEKRIMTALTSKSKL